MLDKNRLSSLLLLQQNGWTPENRINLEQRYKEIERKYQKYQSSCYVPQVPFKDIFPAAKEIIESFEGICIKNLHPKLGLGTDSIAIEFSFFEYDICNSSDLQILNSQSQEHLIFIGIGYDIIGDWLVAESGKIYFYNKLADRLHLVSQNIYEFLERDIYKTEYL